MSVNQVVTARQEQKFLKNNALLLLVLGLLFTSTLWEYLFADLFEGAFISALVGLGEFGLLIYLLVMISKTSRGALSFNKKAFWLGKFEDEFLDFVNRRGYQYALNIIILGLLFGSFHSPWLEFFGFDNEISLSDFSAGLLGFGFMGYAIPVLFLLRGEDE